MNRSPKSRVLLVDDHAVVRTGVKTLLESDSGFEVVGEAANGLEAIREVRRLRPEFVILDISMPGVTGLEIMGEIRDSSPETRIVVLTMHEDEDYFFSAIKAGADGYVVKGAGLDQILLALNAAQEGGVYLHPALAKSLVSEQMSGQGGNTVKALSARELDVLKLIADGFVNKEIAARLNISVSTTQTYRTRIMEKLGLHSVAELIRYAIRKGIIKP